MWTTGKPRSLMRSPVPGRTGTAKRCVVVSPSGWATRMQPSISADAAKALDAYSTKPDCPVCGGTGTPFRSVSFVDAPGHETLMATMLSGSALMDGAMLVISTTEKCPQPQTKEHLMALGLVGIRKIVIVQNKIDVVSQKEAIDNYQQIKAFVKGTIAENAPIIPVFSPERHQYGSAGAGTGPDHSRAGARPCR